MAVSEPVSDSTQVVVDVEASEDDAVPLAREILACLSAERIIEREPSDCILGQGEGMLPALGGVRPWRRRATTHSCGSERTASASAPAGRCSMQPGTGSS